jgi:spermidine/putrescine transport system substrate-binding protein
MEALDPALLEQFPNMKMTPAELLAQEQMVDVGQAQKAYSRTVTEIMNAK